MAAAGLVRSEGYAAAEQTLLKALEDDFALLAGFGELNFAAFASALDLGGEASRFRYRAFASEERTLGLPIEVDPPLIAGEDDDKNGSGHDTHPELNTCRNILYVRAVDFAALASDRA
jgi:hypothetical protein